MLAYIPYIHPMGVFNPPGKVSKKVRWSLQQLKKLDAWEDWARSVTSGDSHSGSALVSLKFGAPLKRTTTVMAMAISYNWLFLWDEKHSNWWGDLLVLITDKWPCFCISFLQSPKVTPTQIAYGSYGPKLKPNSHRSQLRSCHRASPRFWGPWVRKLRDADRWISTIQQFLQF